jgi:hypothetical protein
MVAQRRSSVRKARVVTAKAPKQIAPRPEQAIIGTGQFRDGLHDLATNKKYMEDLGLSRAEIHESPGSGLIRVARV